VTIQEAAAALRARKVSSFELTTGALERIRALNPKLNAFQTLTEESALESARQADWELAKSIDLGPLHGIPIAVKDVFETKGVRTTCGSKLFENFVPDRDAAVVEKLDAAGAVLIGKTGMHELAYGVTSNNPHFGAVRNPWNPECIPGGSSGGSGSAVGSGMVFMAMGSDTGGSIRIPAAFCGTVGLKPTFGRVSRYGVMPLDFSLDHMGPLTRSVRDAALTLEALAGFDSRDETSSQRPIGSYAPEAGCGIPNLRIGWPENFYFDRVDPAVLAGIESMATAARKAGAKITTVRVPDIAAINAVARVVLMSEASSLMEPFLDRRALFGPDVLALFDQGRLISATDYINAQRLRRLMQREFRALWETVDCLITPTAPMGAPKIGAATVRIGDETEDVRLASTRLVRAINLLGLPALSLPCGLDRNGMPLSAQIIGKPFDEATILRVGAVLEDGTEYHTLQPNNRVK
jgi:aspartyl-tRNA(Asn)/glutamyl-tRNA(Gln) amidotransferase subunit A